MTQQLGLFDHLTHRANLKHTRYGWLRLTPAYSVHLVESILSSVETGTARVLDPFCGTGTTALVCAERNIPVDTTDINPFLVWLATTKTHAYDQDVLHVFERTSHTVSEAILSNDGRGWIPAIHQIEKWWDDITLEALSRAMNTIQVLSNSVDNKVIDLLKIVFCRMMITHSNASFNHQSMSFQQQQSTPLFKKDVHDIVATWKLVSQDVYQSAQTYVGEHVRAVQCDARQLTQRLPSTYYTCVITSPPYPNRMSYIRELRPYMYWLGYLRDGREAGELDWQAIGGTWGCATSNVGKWSPTKQRTIAYQGFDTIIDQIAQQSDVLSRYVHKYFYDIVEHIDEINRVLKSNGEVHYIVGNSKFYDVLLPVEEIYAALFKQTGFIDVCVRCIRKRTSKKELFEYVVSAHKP